MLLTLHRVIQFLASLWEQSFGMRSFLVLVLFLLSLQTIKACTSICSNLYRNPDWEVHKNKSDTFFNVSVTPGSSVTGIITASFETFTSDYGKSWDFLRFLNSADEHYQSLVLKIYNSGNIVLINGKMNNIIIGKKTLNHQTFGSIQISDLDSNFYKIFIGNPGEAETYEYNYDDTSTWKQSQENTVRLRDTAFIKSDGRCTVYKFISACSNPTPILCDEQLVTENVNLGSPHTLTCTGSGAPFLDVKWTRDKATVPDWTNTYNNRTADQKISSVVEIDNITFDHLGEWNCTIRNHNFGNNVTKTLVLQYTSPVTLLDYPDLEYYKDNGTETEIKWTVQGWPLKQVTLDCGNANSSVTRNETGYTTVIPPRVRFLLTLRNEDVANCVLKDGDKVLNTRSITRFGYNCTEGEGGIGKDCEVCKPGQTSVAGVGECFDGNSSCSEGDWGIEGSCSPCPVNQTSTPNALKPQDCFPLAPEQPAPPELDANLTVPIAGGAGGFVAVLIMTAVVFLILRRKKPKEVLVGQPVQPIFTGTVEINEVNSTNTILRTIPRLSSDLKDSECAYANMNNTLTRNDCKSKNKENTSKSKQFNSTDRSLTEITSMASRSLEVEEYTPYTNLDEVKRVHSTEKDIEGEKSALARLGRPATKKVSRESGKMTPQNGVVGLKEDPLYAVIMIEDR